jgi:hypothetical protein
MAAFLKLTSGRKYAFSTVFLQEHFPILHICSPIFPCETPKRSFRNTIAITITLVSRAPACERFNRGRPSSNDLAGRG